MTSQPDLQSPKPPRIAGWLLSLFTPPEATEPILGDLLEEFSGLAVNSGVVFARRWYWRQTLKTIWHAGGSAFRTSPWLMLAATAGGMWLIGFATRWSHDAMQTFLDAHRIYDLHPDAYLFWSKFPLKIGRVMICGVVGVLVALVAKRREMAATGAVSLVQIALFLSAVVAVIARGQEWFHWFTVMLLWNGLCATVTVLGGAVVKIRRSSAARGPSAA